MHGVGCTHVYGIAAVRQHVSAWVQSNQQVCMTVELNLVATSMQVVCQAVLLLTRCQLHSRQADQLDLGCYACIEAQGFDSY